MGFFDRFLSFDSDQWESLLERSEDPRLSLAEAEALIEQALAVCARRGGESALVATFVTHGQLLRRHRRFGKAIAMYKKAVEESGRQSGPRSASTMRITTHLADACVEAGRLQEGIALQRQIVAALEAEKDPQLPHCLMNLGQMLAKTDPSEAERLFHRGIAAFEAASGPVDVNLAVALHSLASFMTHQGRFDAFEAPMLRSLAIYRQLDDAWSTSLLLRELAAMLILADRPADAQRRFDEGQPLFMQAARAGGVSALHAATWVEVEADLHRVQGRTAEAEAAYDKAMQMFTEISGPKHPNHISVLRGYATLLRTLGREEDARTLDANRAEIERAHLPRPTG